MSDDAVEVVVAEALVAGGVEASAEEEREGDDRGEGFCDGWNLEEEGGYEDGQEGPESVGGSPELLGEKCSVDGCQKDEREEGVEGGVGAEVLRAQVVEGE